MLLALAVALLNAAAGIAVNPDTSNEPEIPQFWNALTPKNVKNNVGQFNPVPEVPELRNASSPILRRVDGRVPDSIGQLKNPP
jgi:hypothetical protein